MTHTTKIKACFTQCSKYRKLSTTSHFNKTKLPLFGIGCYKIQENEADKVISTAIKAGYRLFDIAKSYGNESFIGRAIQNLSVPRDKFFISTKLVTEDHGYKQTRTALMESLEKLQLDYVDLYLIHSPSGGKIMETWKAFQELKNDGYCREIGVSNFNTHHLDCLLSSGESTLPDINQIEYHPWNQNRKIVEYCKMLDISVMGYCPLARMQLTDPIIDTFAKKYNKTFAQILLRWSIQSKVVTIPKSSTPSRIIENSQIFDFCLTEEEMNSIDTLDSGHQIAAITSIYEPWTG